MCWPIKINGSIDCFDLVKRELRLNRMFYLFNLQTKVILDDEKTIKTVNISILYFVVIWSFDRILKGYL